MDPARWERVQAIFAGALECPDTERISFVERETKGDDALRRDVLRLLAADESAHSILDEGAAEALSPEIVQALSMEGARVGPYRLGKRIGQGGMGAVYIADREEGEFEQRVALKIIKRGMDSEDILSRFRAERQILARLDHPNIARLLDGGLTDDGLPYFTMEFVDGKPIDQYCDDNALSVRDRIELFTTVCDTIRYAQRRLVVHRDLKPGNILVTPNGTVKLLDFGIAKVLGSDDDAPALTMTGHRVMTPGYAAPEQVRGEPVTTATDVYALGVILFELLTGHRPYPTSSSSPRELEEAICTYAPPRPSTIVARSDGAPANARTASDSGTDPTAVGRTRATDIQRLSRALAGDLDNVCLMALRKEPERRYSSAEAFLDDIRRYQSGRPVVARPDTLRYRTQKFLQRNRLAVAASTAALVVLIGLVTFYTVRLASERDRAQREASKARQVADFLSGLFDVADPYTTQGETITARELLDSGAERIRSELTEQPSVQASMQTVIGRVYTSLGLFDNAEGLLEEAVATLTDLHAEEDDPDLAEAMARLGQLRSWQARFEEADSLLSGALDMQKRLFGPRSNVVAGTLNTLAEARNEAGRYEEAYELYEGAVDIWRGPNGDPQQAAIVLNNLALVLNEMARHQEAEDMYRRAITEQRRVLGSTHPELATTLYNFAQFSRAQERLDEAEVALREALDIDRTVYGDEHPNIAYDLGSLGSLLEGQYRLAQADSVFQEALAMRRRLYGDVHSNVAASLNDVGRVAGRLGEYERSRAYILESVDMMRDVSPDHPVIQARLNALGRNADLRGRYAEAEAYYREAESRSLAYWGEDHARTYETRMYLGMTLSRTAADLDSVVAMMRRGVAYETAKDSTGRALTHQLYGLGEVLRRAGRLEEAEATVRRALDRWRRALGDDHPLVGRASLELGRIRAARGDLEGGLTLMRRARDIRIARLGPEHPAVAHADVRIGVTLLDMGRTSEAKDALARALPMLRATFGEDHPDVVECRDALSRAS